MLWSARVPQAIEWHQHPLYKKFIPRQFLHPKTSVHLREIAALPYYGFENSSPDSEISATPKKPHRARDVDNFQPSNISVVETVQSTAQQIQYDKNISPFIDDLSAPDPRVWPLVDQGTPTLEEDVIYLTVFEVERQKNFDD